MKASNSRLSQQLLAVCLLTFSLIASAEDNPSEQVVTMNSIDDQGIESIIGTIKLADSDHGLVITPNLKGLSPGTHGFHVHENPDCGTAEKEGKKTAGLAAGGHFDPLASKVHAGPNGFGHHGDLPALEVNEQGIANQALLSPKLRLADIKGRALIIHAGGDNYSDTPKPLGGGGARIACGVIAGLPLKEGDDPFANLK